MRAVSIRKFRISWTIALVMLVVAPQSRGEDAPDERLSAPPANQWVAVDIDWDKTLAGFREDVKWVTSDGYSDNSFRDKTGEVLIRTGIKSESAGWDPGFYTNTSVLWDPKTDTARVADVFRWGGGSYGGGRLLEGYHENPTPSPRHTWDGMAYVPDEDALYLMFGATWRTATRATDEAQREIGTNEKSTWKFSFGDDKWTRIDDSVRRFWPSTSAVSPYSTHLRHWPAGNKLLFFNNNGNRYAEFDLETQRWKQVTDHDKSPMTLVKACSTWDAKRDLWVFRLGRDLATFDPKTRKFVKLPPCWDESRHWPERREGERRDPAMRWEAKGIVYIPKHDVYLVTGPTGNDTAVYDVEKGSWTPIAAGDIELVNGYLQYDPATDLVLMNYQLRCYKLRYEP
ncbi:MAG: hypothetical protein WD066_15115 [Planctomycetaceae bacterium]